MGGAGTAPAIVGALLSGLWIVFNLLMWLLAFLLFGMAGVMMVLSVLVGAASGS